MQPYGCVAQRITSAHLAGIRRGWGPAVRRALVEHEATLTELADHLGVSRQHVTRIVDGGKPTIPVETYLAICAFVGLDPNQHTNQHESTPPWDSL